MVIVTIDSKEVGRHWWEFPNEEEGVAFVKECIVISHDLPSEIKLHYIAQTKQPEIILT